MRRSVRIPLATALLLAAPPVAGAQQYATMTPGQLGAGACAGSTNGGGYGLAGGFPASQNFDPARSVCDINIGSVAQSAAATMPNVSPQFLSASSAADWGVLKFYAEEHIQNWQEQNLRFPEAFGQAGYLTQALIDDPVHHGQQATFTASLHLTGTIAGHGDQGGTQLDVSLIHHNGFGLQLIHMGIINDPNTYVIDQLLTGSFTVTIGTPFDLGVFAYALTGNRSEGGFNGNPGDALVDFSHTLAWNGFSVSDANGRPLTGLSVSTLDGGDWIFGATAVPPTSTPEPATWSLLLAGLAALGAAARRKTLGAPRRRAERDQA